MKCHVIYDNSGKILSVGLIDWPELERAEERLTRRMGPVVEAGQTVVELHVPDEYARMPAADLTERLQADLVDRQQKKDKPK